MLGLSVESYKLIVISVIALMLILRTGGISFLFRLLLRGFNISYENPKLKKAESIAYDTQLFKALEGINVRNISDAKLIRGLINSGEIHRGNFFFTAPFGYLGDRKRPWYFIPSQIITILCCLLLTIQSYNIAAGHKLGYMRVDYMDQTEYVSLTDIMTKNEDNIIGIKTCEYVLSNKLDHSIRGASCSRFLRAQNEDDYRKWLSKEIEKSDLEYRTFFWGSFFYCFLFAYLSIGLNNFINMNKKILEIKKHHKTLKNEIYHLKN